MQCKAHTFLAKATVFHICEIVSQTLSHITLIIDCLQILLLRLTEFKGINYLMFRLKSSGNLWFSDVFMGSKS